MALETTDPAPENTDEGWETLTPEEAARVRPPSDRLADDGWETVTPEEAERTRPTPVIDALEKFTSQTTGGWETVPPEEAARTRPKGKLRIYDTATVDARQEIIKRIQDEGKFPAFTSAMTSAWDKQLEKNEKGQWLTPPMQKVADKEDGMLGSAVAGMSALIQSTRGKFGAQSTLLNRTLSEIQEQYGLTDDQMKAAWSDLGSIYRKWEDDEKYRVTSDGSIQFNPASRVLLDTDKMVKIVENSKASPSGKRAFLSQLSDIQVNVASNRLGAYEAAAAVVGPVVKSPSEWAETKGRKDDFGSVEFVRDYEREVLGKENAAVRLVRGAATDMILGFNKVATTAIGVGALATGSETLEGMAAEGSEAGAMIGQGKPDTGMVGALIQEAPSVLSQVVLAQLTGGSTLALTGSKTVARGAGVVSAIGAAGAQSAGMTYSASLAEGKSREEAREDAVLAGASTALITGIFQKLGAGGVESVAAGQQAGGVALKDLLGTASKQELWMASRSLAKDLAKASGGEMAEEGIDQIVQAFLTADPDTNLATAWSDAWEAAKVGGFIGGAVKGVEMGAQALAARGDTAAPEVTPDPDEQAVQELLSPEVEETAPLAAEAARSTAPADLGETSDMGAAETPNMGAAETSDMDGSPVGETPAVGETAPGGTAPTGETSPVPTDSLPAGQPAPETGGGTTPTPETDATETRIIPADNQPERVDAGEGGPPTEAGGGDRTVEGGQTDTEAPETDGGAVAPALPPVEVELGDTTVMERDELGEPIGERQATSFSATDPRTQSRAIGTIDNGTFSLTDIRSVDSGGKVSGTRFFERVVGAARDNGARSLKVSLQSADTRAVLKRLVEKGVLENPRQETGISVDRHPTLFDIAATPTPPAPLSPEALKQEFKLTDEQAAAASAIATAMGLTSENVRVGGAEQGTRLQSAVLGLTAEEVARHAELEARFNAGEITEEETAEAEAIVEKAARAAGYDSPRLYHGTLTSRGDFTIFRRGVTAQDSFRLAFDGLGPAWFTSDETQAGRFGDRVVPAYLKLNKPLTLYADDLALAEHKALRSEYQALQRKDREDEASFMDYARMKELRALGADKEVTRGDAFAQLENLAKEAKLQFPDLSDGEAIRQGLKEQGYDGIVLTGTMADSGATPDIRTWAVPFDGEAQIKSADPFTGVPIEQRFNPESPDMRFQSGVVSPEMDAEYLAAVEAGDMAKAQELVDRAARAAGYESPLVWHGTQADTFNRFDPEKTGQKDSGYLGRGFYFSTNEDTASWYAGLPSLPRVFGDADFQDGVFHRAGRRSRIGRFLLRGNFLTLEMRPGGEAIDKLFQTAEALGLDPTAATSESVRAAAIEAGYDGVAMTFGDNSSPMRGAQRQTEYAVFSPEQIKSAESVTRDDQGNVIPLSQRFNPESPDIRFQFAGEKAQMDQFRADSLVTARAMAAGGKSAEEIRIATGWFPGRFDGKMRWEIPDAGATVVGLKPEAKTSMRMLQNPSVKKLGDLLDHPALYAAYPELKNVRVIRGKKQAAYMSREGRRTFGTVDVPASGAIFIPSMKISNFEAGGSGAYEGPVIGVSTAVPAAEFRNSLLHEIQHWIQEKEGFAEGSDAEGEAYTSAPGEIEARDVEARSTMTPEQLAATAPYSSQNIAPEDAPDRFQGPKGVSGPVEAGKAFIRGLTNPDFTTAVHELAHAFEMTGYTGFSDSDVSTLKASFGATTEGRTAMDRPASERFARAWERYLAEGLAPNHRLQGLFNRISQWMLDVYQRITGSPIDVPITPEVRALFDKIAARIENPAAVMAPSGVSMQTVDGSPLPPVIEDVNDVKTEEDIPGYLRGVIERQEGPKEPDPLDWNPEGLFSLQERKAYEESEEFKIDSTGWKQAAVSFQSLWKAVVDAPAGRGAALVAKLIADADPKRVLTNEEVATLTHEGLKRRVALRDAEQQLADALGTGNLSVVEEASKNVEQAHDAYAAILRLSASARTASGRALQAWKYALREDFSPATLQSRLQSKYSTVLQANALPDANLPREQLKRVEAYAAKQQALQAELQKERDTQALEQQVADYEARLAEQEEMIRVLKQEAKTTSRRQAVTPETKKKLTSRIRKAAAEARARLKAAGQIVDDGSRYQAATPETDPLWADRVLVMSEPLITNPDLSDARFADLVAEKFGAEFRAAAAAIRVDAQRNIREELSDITGVQIASPSEVLARIDPASELTRDQVYALAKAHVYEGARDEEVMNRVFSDLSDVFQGIERSEVTQLFTDYGRQEAVNPDEIARQVRLARSLELVLKQIEDLETNESMKKTGRRADEPTPKMRKFRKQRDDLAKKIGFTTTDPDTQKASAAETARKRMENEIQELEEALAENKPRVRVRRGVEYTGDLKVLRERLEALRETYQDTFGQERTPEEINARLLKDLDRRITKEQSLIERGLLTEPPVPGVPFTESPEVIARREELRLLRERKRELYELANPGETALKQAMEAAQKAVERKQATLDAGVPETPARAARGEGVTVTPELAQLWETADALDDVIREIRKARPLTPEREQARLDAAYDRAIQTREELKKRIADNDLDVETPTPRKEDARLRAVRQENDALRKQLNQMRKDAGVGVFSYTVKEAKRYEFLTKKNEQFIRWRETKDFREKQARPEPTTSERIRAVERQMEINQDLYEQDNAKFIFSKLSSFDQLLKKSTSFWNVRMLVNLSLDAGIFGRQLGKVRVKILVDDLKKLVKRMRRQGNRETDATTTGTALVNWYKTFLKPEKGLEIYFDQKSDPRMQRWEKLVGRKWLTQMHETSAELTTDGDIRLNPLDVLSNKTVAIAVLAKGTLAAAVAAGATAATIWNPFAGAIAWPIALKSMAKTLGTIPFAIGGVKLMKRIEAANSVVLNTARVSLMEMVDAAAQNVSESAREQFQKTAMSNALAFSGKIAGRTRLTKEIANNSSLVGTILAYPQHVITNFQVAFLMPLFTAAWATKGAEAKIRAIQHTLAAYSYWLGGAAATRLLLAALFGVWDEEDDVTKIGIIMDPAHPKWGQLKLGNTYINIDGGAMKWYTTLLAASSDIKLNKEALELGMRVEEAKSERERAEVIQRFLMTKLNPNIQTFLQYKLIGEFYEGGKLRRQDPIRRWNTLADEVVMNLTIQQVSEIFRTHGPVKGAALATLLWTGADVDIAETTEERRLRREKEEENYIYDEFGNPL